MSDKQTPVNYFTDTLEKLEYISSFASTFTKDHYKPTPRDITLDDPFEKDELLKAVPPKARSAVSDLIASFTQSCTNLLKNTDLDEKHVLGEYRRMLKEEIESLYTKRPLTAKRIYENRAGDNFLVASTSIEVAGHDEEQGDEAAVPDGISEDSATKSAVVKSVPTIPKKRTSISNESKAFLETVFQTKKTPNSKERQAIAEKCGLTPLQVRVWFTNKRMRTKTDD